MAKIQIETLKPQIGTLRIKHPVLTKINEDGIEEPIDLFPLPDGTEGPLELYVVGRNSQQWFDFMKKLKDMGGDSKDILSKISNEAHEFVSSLIVGWKDNGALDTKYSKEEALSLVKNPENIWIIEQLQVFILNETNFFLKI